jgi:hypothetical protein
MLATLLVAICALTTAAAQQGHAMTFRSNAPGLEENPLRGFHGVVLSASFLSRHGAGQL